MLTKELKRLSRRELVDIIYQLKKNEQEMQDEIASLKNDIQDRRIRISASGSIAEASMSLTNIFSNAQMTADLYLHEIASKKEDAEYECAKMIQEAREKSQSILLEGEKKIADLRALYEVEREKLRELYKEIEALKEEKKIIIGEGAENV